MTPQPGVAGQRSGGGQVAASRPIKNKCCKTVEHETSDDTFDLAYTGKYDVAGLRSLANSGASLDEIHLFTTSENFRDFIDKREDWHIQILVKNKETGENFYVTKSDAHRWSQAYFNKRLARMYKLRAWYDEQTGVPSNMWTFTVPHNENKWGQKVRDGADMYQAWENLKQGWGRLRHCQVMKDRDFVWVIEPHKSGYPHIHTMNFDDFTPDEIIHIQELWHDFTGADILNGSQYDPGKKVKHLIAYLVSYMTDSLSPSVSSWTPQQLTFNAIAHEKGYRLFGSSARMTAIMLLDGEKSDDWDTLKVELLGLKKRDKDDQVTTQRLWTGEPPAKGKLLSEYPARETKKFPPVDPGWTPQSWAKYCTRLARQAKAAKENENWDYGDLLK